ncbi:glycosyltransferase [Thermococcus sp. 101 C5]|uniref:glycosyltransferase family 4 protein n=1 Tax=Thermococcus sp. 101 C5 TaxID=2654197 RepID=UPI00128B67FC|nr:glycosyltransferase family 4 protein [Thermococcus sp. 101 C5]MPW38608.1 glycosyltransferase [Thermococcus sp. 101 C5]
MKILITSIVDLKKVAPNRLHHFIKYLSRNHDISVICINDWWRAQQVDTSKYYESFKKIIDHVDIHYITNKRISPIKQEFLAPVLLELPNDDFDVILNYNTLVSGYYVAKKLGLPMIYDLADDLPEMIANSPQIPKLVRFFGKWWGKTMLKKNVAISKKITGISYTLRDDYSIPSEKFELIPNGVDTKLFKRTKTDLKQKLGLEDYFVLGYVGVLREWVDLTPVYQAIKDLENVKILIVGEEGGLEKNKKLVKEYGIEDKVIFAGTVPYTEVPQYISAMDVCLIPFKPNAISQNAVPLKLFEYMACEKPVISTELSGVKAVAGDRVIYASNKEEYREKILELYKDEELRTKLGKEGRKFIKENYDWVKIVKKMEEILLTVR